MPKSYSLTSTEADCIEAIRELPTNLRPSAAKAITAFVLLFHFGLATEAGRQRADGKGA